ncbi:hypothetical protein Nepgr_024827 [Nepenthes gracilis]|uniref:MADS-box domain-containing protein n=1 Tax=Nepenthes gracilis TaxID=150966 RepID=A0AAD3T5U7_NEPGR|nr:hypothetical protein Nepgr_024827 [Nepenthes gracilis]
MGRKRVELSWIQNESSRKITFKKRKKGLGKKMEELTILCGVEGCLLILNPDGTDPFVWPSTDKAKEMLAQFESLSKIEQTKKMMNYDQYMEEANEKLCRSIAKHEKRNKEMEASQIMHQISHGRRIEALTIEELNVLIWYSEQKLKYIRRRTQLFPKKSDHSGPSLPASEQPPPPPPPIPIEQATASGNTIPKEGNIIEEASGQFFMELLSYGENKIEDASLANEMGQRIEDPCPKSHDD